MCHPSIDFSGRECSRIAENVRSGTREGKHLVFDGMKFPAVFGQVEHVGWLLTYCLREDSVYTAASACSKLGQCCGVHSLLYYLDLLIVE